MKFQVGDIVEGKPSADDEYIFTRAGGEYLVTASSEYEIWIKILKASRCVGSCYSVDPRHFQLINVDLTNE